MRRRWLLIGVSGAAIALTSAGGTASRAATGAGVGAIVGRDAAAAVAAGQPASVIVSLRVRPLRFRAGGRPDVAAARRDIADARVRALGGVGAGDFVTSREYASVPAIVGIVTAAGLARLAAQPDVAGVSLNRATHADLVESAALIHADVVRSQFGLTGSGVTVAVLDSGVQTTHSMLSGDIAGQHCFLINGGCPGGGTSGSSAEDDFGHGTYVSGIVTSSGPPIGIAPDAKIEAYKVIDAAGTGTLADLLSAYDDIITNHPEVRVVNMSLGDEGAYAAGSCEDGIPALTAALTTTRTLGMITFASSGNTGAKTGIAYPACLNDAVAVGAVYDANVGTLVAPSCTDATTVADQITCFSQSGDALDLLAPGSRVVSTYLAGGLINGSGTSAAAPMASGVAAMLLQSDPSLTPAAIELRLRETGIVRTDPANGITTCRIDAVRAVQNLITAGCLSPGTDADGDGVGDAIDDCPVVANAGQSNFDAAGIDNGPGVPGIDTTVPNSDHLGDACDSDRDNDGLPDSEDKEPLGVPGICSIYAGSNDGHGNAASGDNTDLDADGPSWDTDNDGARDGVECATGHNARLKTDKPTPVQCANLPTGGAGGNTLLTDADGDGLTASSEYCKWGTFDANADSDGDGLKDCIEANDTNGDGGQNFPGDTVNSAKAASGIIVKTLDFDLNGDSAVNFPGDTILSAKMVNHVGGICM